MKKVLTAVLTVCLLASSFVFAGGGKDTAAANGTKSGSGSTPGWQANKDTPVKLDWYVNFSWFARHWGDSQVSKYITEKTGVDVNFIVPAGNETEKLNAMIAGDALPDIITLGWYEGQVAMMIDAGLVLPLDELAQKYDPYFFKVADANKLGWYRQNDGHVYGYPNASYTPADYEKYAGKLTSNETFLVRKDMYEAIGSPDMSTPEGFLGALRAAKAKFPTVNGQSLIPFGTNEFNDLGCDRLRDALPHFLALLPEKDGKFYDPQLGPTDPEYVRWLKTFRKAHEEGLIPTDIFVDKRSQIEEKAAQGRYFCMLYYNWDMQAAQNALYEKDPNSIYIAVNPPRNSRGDEPTLGGAGIAGWTVTLISKNCKDPARAMQFMTYLISEEGQMDTNFGIKDVTYSIGADGIPALLPAVQKLDQNDKNRQETEIGVQYTYWMLMDTAWQQQWGITYAPSLEQPQLWTRPYVHSFAVYDNLMLPAGSDEALIFEEIQRRWGKVLPALLRAPSDAEFDKIWSDFAKFKKDKGIDKVVEAQTKMMNANKEKLGMK
ncbi:extracellular solute-binding protein [Treponema brennaborense]|uniref:Extracellular solute-binding protein family 1 n=1 Tax=Treponema brennaborense (strain DSM 12168 / CIP 105900 / DD5/3) TaxID=906968 RepID=F4LND2_TREBD|nr:extracellular solute-binding protein [Treponema brennaborense]AEE17890.1 extracellular solute-binding protein family 1 [Treponema brennaborense DSM 12168]